MKTLPPIEPEISRASTLPAWAYRDPELFEAQRERVFATSWQLAGDADQARVPGQVQPFTLLEGCLDELGICFCFGPLMHPAMEHVAEVRKELGIRTIFNVLGPLSNPAGASHQLLGAGRPELRPLLASALRLLDVQHALVVSGEDGLGEATLTGRTLATDVSRGEEHEVIYRPEDFGLAVQSLDTARVESPAESAAIVRGVLAGQAGAARDIVILNAACGLITVDPTLEPAVAAKRAAESIDSGAAGELLRRVGALSHSE